MLFKRAQPRPFKQYVREMIWPTMHWRRVITYFQHRLFRHSDSTYRVAGGLAMGVAVSFTPLLGLQIVQAFLFAHIFRQSKVAALVGTLWGNPWTFPLMFYGDYKLGVWLMDMFWDGSFAALPAEHSLEAYMSNPLGLFLPLLIGGAISAVMAWFVAYALLFYPVRMMQRVYVQKRAGIMKPAEAA